MKNSSVLFRNLTKNDWAIFKDLDGEAFPNDEISEEDYSRLTLHEGFIGCFNKKQSNEIIGYLYLTRYSDYAHLNRIAVKKDKRGLGFGNLLMEYAIKYFSKFNPKDIGIYVETHNTPAISLYKKYGFRDQYESWHYIIDLASFDKNISPQLNLDNYEIKLIDMVDLTKISKKFPEMNFTEMKSGLKSNLMSKDPRIKFFGLLKNQNFVAFARFSPDFSGCRPFHYESVNDVDPFIELIKKYKLPGKDHIRITFDKYTELADLFTQRNYKQHHHLFRLIKPMT